MDMMALYDALLGGAHMKRRALSLLLALVMALGMAAPAFAADEFAMPEEE